MTGTQGLRAPPGCSDLEGRVVTNRVPLRPSEDDSSPYVYRSYESDPPNTPRDLLRDKGLWGRVDWSRGTSGTLQRPD